MTASDARRAALETAKAHSQPRDVVVIGASAGGIEALRRLVPLLPASLAAAIAIAVHLSPTSESLLPQQLGRGSALPVLPASDNVEFRRGRVYVSVPDRHLIVRDGVLALTRDATEHFHRPAVDPLFRSAAKAYGARVVGVVLSGAGHDGVEGAVTIKAAGGLVLAQDPSEARHPGMPRAAIARGVVDAVLSIDGLAARLRKLGGGDVTAA
ncbi:MAG TPA: chemotaxis protein CheB [Methylomirabilota bacterium]